MASDQIEYCGECERKEQCRIALQNGKFFTIVVSIKC